jgi:predicted small lipoprotein YifL
MRKLACLLFTAIAITACGKKGPLIYPDLLVPAAPSNVSAQQSGNSMKLSFVLPSKDLAGRKLDGVAEIKILRRDEPAGQIPGCSACTADFVLFRNINLEPLPSDIQRFGSLVLLLDGDVKAGRSYTYRISVFTKDKQEGAVSTSAAAVLLAPLQSPVLQVSSQPTEILLEFSGASSREGIIAGYNMYRAAKGDEFSLLPMNGEPLAGNRFVDQGLERAVKYKYAVRSVIRLPSGGVIESAASNEVEAQLKDDE